MRLVGVALAGPALGARRRAPARRGPATGWLGKRENSSSSVPFSPSALEVADDERAAARRRPAARAEGDDPVTGEGVADVLGGPEHRAAQRVIAERGLVDQVLGHHRGLVVGARDLLDDHAALAVELVGIDPRPTDEVGQQIGRLQCALRARGDVEGHQIVAGVRVEHGSDALRSLVDVAVGGVLLAALEHEVLEEVGHPVLLRALGASTRVEGDENRHRARAVDRDPVERKSVCERRLRDRWHRMSTVAPGRPNVRGREGQNRRKSPVDSGPSPPRRA